MPMLFWVVPYIIAGGIMWFVSNQTAPLGREIPLSKAIVAVFFMGLCSVASGYWLQPIIGNWRMLVELVAWTIVVMVVLELSFRRALLAVIIYFAVIFIATLIMVLDVRYHHANGRSSNNSPEPTPTALSVPHSRLTVTAARLIF